MASVAGGEGARGRRVREEFIFYLMNGSEYIYRGKVTWDQAKLYMK